MQTDFPHSPEHTRIILDEFLQALRTQMDDDNYMPGPSDRTRWNAGAHTLYNNFNTYPKGFMLWAVPKHCKTFPDCRYIPSPNTVRYLWEKYEPKKDAGSYYEGGEEPDIEREEYIRCPDCGKDIYEHGLKLDCDMH